jgi:Flp pilus assembly protein TadG
MKGGCQESQGRQEGFQWGDGFDRNHQSHHPCRWHQAQSGQELVEFAIAFPILILVIFGLLDLGRLFYASITITNASREGARYGMVYPSDIPGIEAAVRSEAQNNGIDLANIAISSIIVSCPDIQGCVSNHPIRVTVTYAMDLAMGWLVPSPVVVSRYTEMLIP